VPDIQKKPPWLILRILRLQMILAAACLGLAIAPFTLVWLIGAMVAHNNNFLTGMAWYVVGALTVAMVHVIEQMRQSFGAEAGVLGTFGRQFAVLLCLPSALYLSAKFVSLTDFAGGDQPQLFKWLFTYLYYHMDIVTAGLSSSIFVSDEVVDPLSQTSRLVLFTIRLLYAIGVVAMVSDIIRRDASQTGKTRPMLFVALISLAICCYVAVTVSITAAASLIPQVFSIVAVAAPLLLHFGFLLILIPALHKARLAARRAQKAMQEKESEDPQ